MREAFYDRIDERSAELEAAIRNEVIRVITVDPVPSAGVASTPSKNSRGGKATPKGGSKGGSKGSDMKGTDVKGTTVAPAPALKPAPAANPF